MPNAMTLRTGDIVAWHGNMLHPLIVAWANDSWRGQTRVSARYADDGSPALIDFKESFSLIKRPSRRRKAAS